MRISRCSEVTKSDGICAEWRFLQLLIRCELPPCTTGGLQHSDDQDGFCDTNYDSARLSLPVYQPPLDNNTPYHTSQQQPRGRATAVEEIDPQRSHTTRQSHFDRFITKCCANCTLASASSGLRCRGGCVTMRCRRKRARACSNDCSRSKTQTNERWLHDDG